MTEHVAEICERSLSTFNAIEFIIFVDGCLLESQMFHRPRVADYGPELEARSKPVHGRRMARPRAVRSEPPG